MVQNARSLNPLEYDWAQFEEEEGQDLPQTPKSTGPSTTRAAIQAQISSGKRKPRYLSKGSKRQRRDSTATDATGDGDEEEEEEENLDDQAIKKLSEREPELWRKLNRETRWEAHLFHSTMGAADVVKKVFPHFVKDSDDYIYARKYVQGIITKPSTTPSRLLM